MSVFIKSLHQKDLTQVGSKIEAFYGGTGKELTMKTTEFQKWFHQNSSIYRIQILGIFVIMSPSHFN